MRELWILRGLPGSGKSEFALLLTQWLRFPDEDDPYEDYQGIRISLDTHLGTDGFDPRKAAQWTAEDLKRCEECMAVYVPLIIVDNVFAHPWEMSPYRELAKLYKYKCRSLIMENRHDGKARHFIAPEVVSRMERRFKVKLR